MFFNQGVGLLDGELADEVAVVLQGAVLAEEEDLGGVEGFGDLDGHGVGVDAVALAVAVEAEGREDRDDALVEEELEADGVDAVDLAGVLLVHAAEDAGGVGDDGVGVGGAQVYAGEALHDLVRDAGGGVERDLEGGVVGDAAAVGVGEGGVQEGGALLDLVARAVDDDDADVERAEDREVQQDVGEVVRVDDLAVERDDEGTVAETRDVLEDAAEVGNLHGREGSGLRRRMRDAKTDAGKKRGEQFNADRGEGKRRRIHHRGRQRRGWFRRRRGKTIGAKRQETCDGWLGLSAGEGGGYNAGHDRRHSQTPGETTLCAVYHSHGRRAANPGADPGSHRRSGKPGHRDAGQR